MKRKNFIEALGIFVGGSLFAKMLKPIKVEASVSDNNNKATYTKSEIEALIQNAIKDAKSYVGMTILSTTLKTETEVIKKLGGTKWIQHTDYVIRGASNGVTANNPIKTGGEDTHTLTINEMPSHTHKQNSHSHGFSGNSHQMGPVSTTHTWDWCSNVSRTSVYGDEHPSGDVGDTHWSHFNWTDGGTVQGATATNQNTGGGKAHNNMQSYKDFYIWERVA